MSFTIHIMFVRSIVIVKNVNKCCSATPYNPQSLLQGVTTSTTSCSIGPEEMSLSVV